MKQNKIIFRSLKSVNEKHRDNAIKIWGQENIFPKKHKTDCNSYQDKWNCREDTAVQFNLYIYMQGIPASNSCPCLLLLEIWKKDLVLPSVVPAWMIRSVKANSGQILFKTILKVMGSFLGIQYSWLWAFSYLSLHSPLICSTSSSNVTELLLRGG